MLFERVGADGKTKVRSGPIPMTTGATLGAGATIALFPMLEFDPVAWWVEADVRKSLLPDTPRPTIGRYDVHRLIGHGGTGVVFEAEDTELGRHVALKVLRPFDVQSRLQARIRKEARALAQVRHPGIVTVMSVDEFRGSLVIVMELLKGPTLQRWLEDSPRPVEIVLERFLEAGEALAAAHAVDVLHGDFKCDNVMLTESGAARVVDFGLTAEPLATSDRQVLSGGTEHAMSPEQRRGDPLDARSDQYCFCVALRDALVLADGAPSARVARALRRGLSEAAVERFSDMRTLLLALRPPSTARRLRGWAAAAAIVVGSTAVVAATRPPPASCEPRPLWSSSERDGVLEALGDAGSATLSAWREFDRTVTKFDESWIRASRELCEARQREEITSELADAASLCLEMQGSKTRGLVSALSSAKAADYLAALGGNPRLGDPAACGASRDAPPSPAAREIMLDAARVGGLGQAGALDEALTLAKAVLARAEADGDPVGLMHAHVAYGSTLIHEASDPTLGAKSLEVGYELAAGRDIADPAFVGAFGMAVYSLDRDAARAAEWIGTARTWALRLDPASAAGPLAKVALLEATLVANQDPANAPEVAAEAVRRCEDAYGHDDLLTSQATALLADVLVGVERFEEAEAPARDALQIIERVMPDTLESEFRRTSLAIVLSHLGRREEALALRGQALDNAKRIISTEHRMYAYFALNYASALLATPRRPEGIELLRDCLAGLAAQADPDAETVHETARILAVVAEGDGRFDDAWGYARRSHAALEALGEDNMELVRARIRLADLAARRGDAEQARGWLARVDASRLSHHPHVVARIVAESRIASLEGQHDLARTLAADASARAEAFGPMAQGIAEERHAELHPEPTPEPMPE